MTGKIQHKDHQDIKKSKGTNVTFTFRKKKKKTKNITRKHCKKRLIPTSMLMHKILSKMHVSVLMMQ